MFTPYYKQALTFTVTPPQKLTQGAFYSDTLKSSFLATHPLVYTKNSSSVVTGGTAQAQKIVRPLEDFTNYEQEHNFPSIATTHLSAHNKFGTVSIRTVYHAIYKKLGKSHPLLRQLYWRDFFTTIAFFFPFVFGNAFKEKYNNVVWSTNKKFFEKWCKGMTGFPIVDAGMRELNATGFMHNRARLITGSFLVKDLHINWLWGEKYFAQQLIDYDPSVNNGNWQWVASTGCDSQPYFRIFNPWLQQKKFDPECIYIKKWLPEVKNIPIKDIHNWYKTYSEYDNYHPPLVEHDYETKKAKIMYKNSR